MLSLGPSNCFQVGWSSLNRIAMFCIILLSVAAAVLLYKLQFSRWLYLFQAPVGIAGVDTQCYTCWIDFTCHAHCWPLSDVGLPDALIIFCSVGLVPVGTGRFAELHPWLLFWASVSPDLVATQSCWFASSGPLSMVASTGSFRLVLRCLSLCCPVVICPVPWCSICC